MPITLPAFNVPTGACDCHVHVFGPPERFPFAPGRKYTPSTASVEQLLALQRQLRLERAVIVQPSAYGTDNTCTLDALRRLGNRARGVAVIDAHTPEAALGAMHAAGVRGVRVNLETGGERDVAIARRRLQEAAARVTPLGWHVQTYAALPILAALHDDVLALPTPLVVDHFGLPHAAAGITQPGFDALLSLVLVGKAYVKLSAPHRISAMADCADVSPLARALIAANPQRVLWGSDWPHTSTRRGVHDDHERIEPFDEVDDGLALERLNAWTMEATLFRGILVDNPARLYDF
jgi:predicted TIM-barrel fold metal-dependent hydrolase